MRKFLSVFVVVCWARAACPFGPPVECAVYADPLRGQSCDWVSAPFEVRCRGWDLFGNYVSYGARCPLTAAAGEVAAEAP